MIVIRSMDDPRFAGVPSSHRPAVERAVRNLCSIRGPDPHPEDWGFVVFIEPTDDLECVSRIVGKDISVALEGAFHDDGYLVGVVLYGNSGSGVTLVCPDAQGYATPICDIFRSNLTGGSQ